MARLFTTKPYSVVETTQVEAVRTGKMAAQYSLDAALSAGIQNGQLYVVDERAKKIKAWAAAGDYVYLHASEERIYESHLGRSSFILTSPNLPRMLKLAKGDKFETDAVDKGAYADLAAVEAAITAKTISAVAMASGDIKLLATSALTTEPVVLIPVEVVLLPHGGKGIKFVVDKA